MTLWRWFQLLFVFFYFSVSQCSISNSFTILPSITLPPLSLSLIHTHHTQTLLFFLNTVQNQMILKIQIYTSFEVREFEIRWINSNDIIWHWFLFGLMRKNSHGKEKRGSNEYKLYGWGAVIEIRISPVLNTHTTIYIVKNNKHK